MNGLLKKVLFGLALLLPGMGAVPAPMPNGGEALAQDRGERIHSRVEQRRERLAERAQRLERLGALRAERPALRRPIEYRAARQIAERRRAAAGVVLRNRYGEWVRRSHILSLAPDAAALEQLAAAGFTPLRRRRLGALDIDLVILAVPDGLDLDEALALARGSVPGTTFVADHVFDPSGAPARSESSTAAISGLPWADLGPADGLRIGQIDLGVDTDHPAFAAARIVAQNFTGEAAPVPSDHGTAVASLLVGTMGEFGGAAAGATLYAADVFGNDDAGGSIGAILGALDWMASESVPVVAMPLVGPANGLLDLALDRLARRGTLVVAPVGNDGPTLPVAWPAAHGEVIAVTATTVAGEVFVSAQRGPEVMFSAVGVALPAAAGPEGLAAVEGTSFAVPEVAGRLLRKLARPDPATGREALAALAAAVRDLGSPGRDPVYGEGWVSYPENE